MSALHQFLAIRRAANLWESRADAELGSLHGIGLSDFATLHCLAESAGGKLRRVDLARKLALTPSGVTRLLGPLERRGIVTRQADRNDARASFVILTARGKTLATEAAETLTTIAESILGSLGERDRAAFQRLVDR